MASVDPDRRAALEEERDHLLASLDDLEAEFRAGDLDDDDYEQLRDDYTARAAEAIRALDDDAGDQLDDDPPGRNWLVTAAWSVGVLAVALLAGVLIAQASGTRGEGEVGSGEIRQTSRQLLFAAGEAQGAGDYDEAIDLYSELLETEPAHVEALTYRGWVRSLGGDAETATVDLDDALALDPEYPDAVVFSAIVARRDGRSVDAAAHLVTLAGLESSPMAEQLVAASRIRETVADDLAAGGDTVAAVEFLEQLQALDPDDVAIVAHRGWVLARVSVDSPELQQVALDRFDEAEVLDPTFPDIWVYRAFLLRQLDRIDEARAALAVYDELVADGSPPSHIEELLVGFDLRGDLG